MAARKPREIGKSKEGPSFFTSAGARFIVTLFGGYSKRLFLIADLILSLLSFTARSGSPTIIAAGSP